MKPIPLRQRPRSRLRRWFLFGVGALLLLGAAAVALVGLAIHNLDSPFIKRRVRQMLLAEKGVDVDYGAVRVGLLTGIDIDGIVAKTPGPLAGFAPEMARIAHVHARWAPSTILGPHPSVDEVDVDGVAFTLVLDESGASSLDPIKRKPSPPTPLSAEARELVEETEPVRKLRVKDVTLALVRVDRGAVIERDTLTGFAVDADATRTGAGSLAVALGSETAPLDLRLERQREGESHHATAQLTLVVNATPADAKVSFDARIQEQDLVPQVRVAQLARFDVEAKFDEAHKKSELAVEHAVLGDGVLTTDAQIDLPDEGPPFVRHALGDLDAAKALALLPADLVPIQLGKGRVHYQVDELAIDRPTTSAKVALDVEVADAMVPVGAGSASVDSAQLTLRVQPSDKGLGVEAEAHWGELRVEQKAPNGLSARDCKFAIHAHDLAVDTKDPMATRGDVAFDGSIGSLENRGALRSTFSELKLRAHAPLSGAPPFALDASVEAKRFALAQPNGKLMVDTPARLDLGLKNVTPDREHPRASQGEAHLVLSAGALDVKLDADKKADEVSFDLTTKAGTLAGVRRIVPESVATRAPWDAMAVDLHTTASVEHFGNPQIHQQSHLHLTGAAFAPARVPDVTLDFHSDGSAAKHEAELTARAGSVVIDKTELGADELQMSLTVDRSKPALAVKIANHGAMDSELDGSFGFDSSDRAVTYELAGRLAKLAPILPLLNSLPGLAHFDFESFGLRLQSRGRVTGVISRIDGQSIVVAPDPARTLGAKGTAQFEMTKFRWAEGDRAITVPAGTLRTSFHGEGQHRSMESDFSADDVEIGLGRHRLSIAGLRDETAASWIGSFGDGAAEVSHRASIREVQQNFYPTYPVANVTTSLAARLDAEGVFKVSAFRLENAAGGSTITLTGGVDLSADQRRLSLRTTIDQDLSRFSTRPERFTGSGKAGVELSVESPDFRVFHSRARVSLEGATIRLPRSGIVLENVDGEVPIVTDVALGQHGPELLRDAHLNPYAVLRFADQHPLLSHRSFLSIGSVTTPMVSIAPFAANLRIEQNFFSLSQLEMGVRGGSVTGSGILDWNGGKTQVHADLHATGVQSSHGEPFDGNASLVIDMGDRSVEGRADILRIGSRHLLDLLDVQDPHRANAQLNRIRGALSLGYPERVRIAFKHGFMSAGVSLGGLARLVSIDDVRGIPIGPLMERMMRSFKPPEEQ